MAFIYLKIIAQMFANVAFFSKFAKDIEAVISIDFTACIVGLILPKSVLCC